MEKQQLLNRLIKNLKKKKQKQKTVENYIYIYVYNNIVQYIFITLPSNGIFVYLYIFCFYDHRSPSL